MTPVELRARLGAQGVAALDALLAALRQPGADARALGNRFFALAKRDGTDEELKALGRAWAQLRRENPTPRATAEAAPLESLVARLPYPLGLTAAEWLRAAALVQEGAGESGSASGREGHLPFLACRVAGVALRLAAAVAVRVLVESGSKDAAANALVVSRLRAPSDGAWLELAQAIAQTYAGKHPWATLLERTLEEKPGIHHAAWTPPRGGKAPRDVTVRAALQGLVSFRNRLVHGEAPDDAAVREACAKVEVVLRGFGWMADASLRVRHEDAEWLFAGAAPTRASTPVLDASLRPGAVYLVYEGEGRAPLSLSPLMVFRPASAADATVDADEAWFLNAGTLERLSYVGYRAAHPADGRRLGSYEDFKALLASLPTPPIPADPRFDDAALADFHGRLFVGRGDVLDDVHRQVAARTAPWLQVTALPGMGKTALLSRLWAQHQRPVQDTLQARPGDVWVFHFCGDADGRNSPTAALRSLTAQLCDAAGLPRDAWLSMDLEELRERRFPGLVHEVASRLPEGRRLVLALDALDEGFGAEAESVASSLVLELPPNAVGLLSWRVPSATEPNTRVEAALRGLRGARTPVAGASPLVGLTRTDVADFLARLGATREVAATEAVVERAWDAATRASGGDGADPFFLRLLADGFWAGEVRLERPETLPEGLDDAFESLWMGLPTDNDFLAHRVLLALAILREPGTDELLAELISLERPRAPVAADDIARARQRAGKLLVYEGERYRLFHQRFKQFLVGEQKDPIEEALAAAPRTAGKPLNP